MPADVEGPQLRQTNIAASGVVAPYLDDQGDGRHHQRQDGDANGDRREATPGRRPDCGLQARVDARQRSISRKRSLARAGFPSHRCAEPARQHQLLAPTLTETADHARTLRTERAHRTSPDDRRPGAAIGTYALVALEAQIAGYGRDVSGFSVRVMCALLTSGIAPERAIGAGIATKASVAVGLARAWSGRSKSAPVSTPARDGGTCRVTLRNAHLVGAAGQGYVEVVPEGREPPPEGDPHA
jgi:hypothetical protein